MRDIEELARQGIKEISSRKQLNVSELEQLKGYLEDGMDGLFRCIATAFYMGVAVGYAQRKNKKH